MRSYRINGERVVKDEFWKEIRKELPKDISDQEYRKLQTHIWKHHVKTFGSRTFESRSRVSF